MEQKSHSISSLAQLLDTSSRPIYAVDARRKIVYCNRALADWLGVESPRIVGRLVEYHSETTDDTPTRDSAGPLAGLCPPPKALAGEPCHGTVACLTRGRLVHRRAEFVPLALANSQPAGGDLRTAVLALLAAADMTPEQLSDELSPEPAADELHRTIRRFRRGQAAEYAIESLLGNSSGMRKVRTQIAAAAAGRANILIRGRRGSGRAHVARAIHYSSPADDSRRLVPIDCEVAGDDLLRRSLDSLHHADATHRRATVLLLDVERLSPELVPMLLPAVSAATADARFVATLATSPPSANSRDDAADLATPRIEPRLLDALSTITIDVPPLAERAEDLPLLAQCFLEACNRGGKQVGSVRFDALDLLALHRWPGELDELRTVIAAAHAVCSTHEITPADLPAIIQHAAHAAALPRRTVERIVLDDLLASIEREAIVRAMTQAGGNKSAAAELLGMTRPRFYRRLVQLGLIQESTEGDSQ